MRLRSTAGVPQTSQSAVSRVSQPAHRPLTGRVRFLNGLPIGLAERRDKNRVHPPILKPGEIILSILPFCQYTRTRDSVLQCGCPLPLSRIHPPITPDAQSSSPLADDSPSPRVASIPAGPAGANQCDKIKNPFSWTGLYGIVGGWRATNMAPLTGFRRTPRGRLLGIPSVHPSPGGAT